MINDKELHQYAKSFGAVYSGENKSFGVKKNGKPCDKKFRFIKKGFDERWVYASSVTYGSNPFNTPTPNETIKKWKDNLWEKNGARFTGKYERRHDRMCYFEISKKGYENRWIAAYSLVNNYENHFFRLTENEQTQQITPFVKKLGATIVGYKKNKHGRLAFEISKKGCDNRTTTLYDLKEKGENPYQKATINEQLSELQKLVKRFKGVVATGRYRRNAGNTNNVFQLKMEGRVDRWPTLGVIRKAGHPFTKPVLEELIAEIKQFAKSHDAIYTGNKRKLLTKSKKITNYQFELAKKGYDTRWCLIDNLRKGKDPFAQPTINEQLREIKTLIKALPGVRVTGKHNGKNGPYRRFEFTLKGRENRWAHIGDLRDGGSLFTKPTISEQEKEVLKELKAFPEISYTGRHRTYKGARRFELRKKGHKNRWIILGNLRRIRDPFGPPSGYRYDRAGFLYVLLITLANGKQLIKLGITNRLHSRYIGHGKILRKIGAKTEVLYELEFEDPYECAGFETGLKRLYKKQCKRLGLAGFNNECFDISIKRSLLCRLAHLTKDDRT